MLKFEELVELIDVKDVHAQKIHSLCTSRLNIRIPQKRSGLQTLPGGLESFDRLCTSRSLFPNCDATL